MPVPPKICLQSKSEGARLCNAGLHPTKCSWQACLSAYSLEACIADLDLVQQRLAEGFAKDIVNDCEAIVCEILCHLNMQKALEK